MWNRFDYGRKPFSASSASVLAPSRISWATRKRCSVAHRCASLDHRARELRLVGDQAVDAAAQSQTTSMRVIDGPDVDVLTGAVRAPHEATRGHARLDGKKVGLELGQIAHSLRDQEAHSP